MKKLWKKVVSFILIAILTIPAVNVAWAEEMSFSQNEVLSQEEIDFYMRDMYEGLNDDARSILEEYMINYDHEMLNYYEDVTGRTVSNSDLQARIMFESEEEQESRAAAVTGMQYLGNALRAMNLTTEVYNALMGVGADIAALGAGITVSGVVAALAVVTVTVILYKNWDKVKGLWSRIVTAFKDAFAKSTSSSGAIQEGFAKKKSETDQVRDDYRRGDSALRTGTLDKNADKHISKDFVDRIRKSNTPSEIYYSSKRRVLLYVYKVPSGYKTDLNESLAKNDKEYDLTDYNVSGFTVYILVNPTSGKVFHCHLRRNKSDLEQFRNANQLDWRFKPTPVKYESKYTNATGTGVFTGKQTD